MTIRGFRARPAERTPLRLDLSQRAVIRLRDDESAAVLGAPGTGKTTTVVELVADRLANRGYDPAEILVIAPHRRAASALRDRLALRTRVPSPGPLARTLNSVAFQVVRGFAAERGDDAPRLLTGAEQDAIVADLIRGHEEDGGGPAWPDEITPDVRGLSGFRTELRELMMRATEAGVRPHELAELGRRHDRGEWEAAADFIDEYERVVDSFGVRSVDSSELVAEATALIRAGYGLQGLRLVVVDDFQEQGTAILHLLRALVSRGVAVVAAGDPDVTASTFRGSDPAALSTLGAALGVQVSRLSLSTVYRHGAAIRALVHEATTRVGTAGAGLHRDAEARDADDDVDGARAPDGDSLAEPPIEPILRIEAPSPTAQYQRIARVLREHHLFRDVPWSRMGVVVRSGAQVATLARSLAVAEVPTASSARVTSASTEYASRQLVHAVAVALGRIDPEIGLVMSLLTGPFCGIDALALRRVRLALRHEEIAGGGNRSGDDLLLEAIASPGRLATIDSPAARRAGRFAQTLADAAAQAEQGATVEELLWLFWERSGLEHTWTSLSLGSGPAADEANRHLDAIMALFTSAKRFVERYPDEPAGRFIDDMLDAQVPEDSLTPVAAADAVWIGTPSGTVGVDFDVVVLAGLQEGAWPNPRLRGGLLHPQRFSAITDGLPVEAIDERADVLSDEIRMFALAVSRGRRQVVLSAVSNEEERPSVFFRFPAARSAPLQQVDEHEHQYSLRGLTGMLRRRAVTTGDPAAASALAKLAAHGVSGADPGDWYGLLDVSTSEPLVDLDEPEATVSVSPSRLETYEKSPLAWFVDTMAAAPSGLAAGIGTIVHAAMERAGGSPDGQVNEGDLTVDALWRTIDEHWSELYFEAPWLAERSRLDAKRLVEGLSEYLTDAHRSGNEVVSSEGRFEVELGQIRLVGTIDRVERNATGEVTIVDLKTGRSTPTTREVQTHAQLASYQLALERGAVSGTTTDDSSGGAALLYVSGGARGKQYRLLRQAPLDDAQRAAFASRVESAGAGMAGATFWGATDLTERDPKAGFMYRIHLVAAVSA